MHTEYIDKIIMTGNDEQMRELKKVLIDVIDYARNNDQSVYDKIECDLYEIAEGKVLSKEKADEWVRKMVPKGKWNYSTINQLKNDYNFEVPLLSAYVIMNMLYSDFSDVLGENITEEVIQRYIKAMEDWYYDEDATHTEDEKLYYYWKNIVN